MSEDPYVVHYGSIKLTLAQNGKFKASLLKNAIMLNKKHVSISAIYEIDDCCARFI
jgi:hypothetical protein